jgi:parallel beta-helix repeat protein
LLNRTRALALITPMLLLLSFLALLSSTPPAKAWNGTVYIETDGTVDPSDAPIGRNGNVYTLTDNIYSDGDGILVLCDDIVIDGAGHTVQGADTTFSMGISLNSRSGITIRNLVITAFDYGIFLYQSSDSKIIGSDITTNYYGIWFFSSSGNNITANEVTENSAFGIGLYSSSNNNIQGNNVTYNGNGIGLDSISSNNRVFHNNLETNNFQAQASESYDNFWDEGYPSGGNFWNDYNGSDYKCGPSQDHPGSDGMGDTPYIIDSNNQDNYPLMNTWTPPTGHNVAIISVISAKTVIGQGYSGNITVYGANKGEYLETFSVTTYADVTPISSTTVPLGSGSTKSITFSWNTNGTPRGNYTINAHAWQVPGETDTSDNNFTDGWILVSVVGDVSGDGKVNLVDVFSVALAYGSVPGMTKWNPNLDVNNDGKINLIDYFTTALNYGKS